LAGWTKKTVRAIAIIGAVRLALIFWFDLTPQEAYYWNFGRHPALGYYDHPSVMPWTIFLTTRIFGDTRFGIRLGAWGYGLGALAFLYLIARKLWDERTAFWAVVFAGTVPLFNVAGIFFTPDPPLIFFWLGATYFLLLTVQTGRWSHWILAGLFSGLAMLSKYTAAFWFVGAATFLILTPNRRYLLTPKPYAALAIALAAFSPEIIWNAQHQWASFLYQSARRAHEIKRLRIDYFFGYLGAQFFAVSPIAYIGAVSQAVKPIFAAIRRKTAKIPQDLIVVSAFSAPMILFFSAVALFYWVKLNWIIPAYFLPLAGFVREQISAGKKWHLWGIYLSAGTTLVVIGAMLLPFVPITGELASTFGWEELARRVEKHLRDMPPGTFVFGGEYKVPAELSYHLPGKPQTAGPDIIGRRGQQFPYWVDKDTLIGRDALMVIDPRWGFGAHTGEKLAKKFFQSVQLADTFRVFRGGKAITKFYIYRCRNYRGKP